ncbi:MAG: hypothetical protein FWD15_00930 [Alphaproteobacteria bacterium]|nr:hypothetical protein [Alphaproteobacteria bacterium]
MRKNNYCGLGAGYVGIGQFRDFIDKHPFIRHISASSCGEVFLNPDIVPIMKYAFEKGISLDIGTGTNLNTVSLEALEALVKYRVLHINVALDGACQETYVKYRRGGDFDKVIGHIRTLNEIKRKYNARNPYVNWQYVVLPTNDSESEIKAAKAMASSLDMKIMFVKDWDGYTPVDLEMIKRETGLDYGSSQMFSMSEGRFLPCFQLFKYPQINWDGRFLGCCYANYANGGLGLNAFEIGLGKCLDSRIVRETKAMLLGGRACPDSPCINCTIYKNMLKENNFATKKEIDELARRYT